MEVTYLGHSSYYVKTKNGVRILVDPFIDGNPKTSLTYSKYPVDAIFLTHGHGDHVGDAAHILEETHATLISSPELIEAFRYHHEDLEFDNEHISVGGSIYFRGVKIRSTMALHSSSYGLSNEYDGVPSGVIIREDDKKVYISGDTGVFMDMELIGRLEGQLDVAFLPIGGRYTMDIDDAVIATEMIKAKLTVPSHYNTFEDAIKANPYDFLEKVKAKGFESKVMEPDEVLSL